LLAVLALVSRFLVTCCTPQWPANLSKLDSMHVDSPAADEGVDDATLPFPGVAQQGGKELVQYLNM